MPISIRFVTAAMTLINTTGSSVARPRPTTWDPQPGKPARLDLPRQIADAVERMAGDAGIGAGDVDDVHFHDGSLG